MAITNECVKCTSRNEHRKHSIITFKVLPMLGIYNQINNNCIEYAITVHRSYTFYVDIQLFTYILYNFARIFIKQLCLLFSFSLSLGVCASGSCFGFASVNLYRMFFTSFAIVVFFDFDVCVHEPHCTHLYTQTIRCAMFFSFPSLWSCCCFLIHLFCIYHTVFARAMSGERIFSHKLSHLRINNKLFTYRFATLVSIVNSFFSFFRPLFSHWYTYGVSSSFFFWSFVWCSSFHYEHARLSVALLHSNHSMVVRIIFFFA